jgi:hypothetical protein
MTMSLEGAAGAAEGGVETGGAWGADLALAAGVLAVLALAVGLGVEAVQAANRRDRTRDRVRQRNGVGMEFSGRAVALPGDSQSPDERKGRSGADWAGVRAR